MKAGPPASGERWVFGYGSLMWRPGFRCVERRQALLRGLHRRLCIYSHVHRGTPERPGLVMGLDRGGACRGIAFRVGETEWPDTLAYLRAREQVTSVYLERCRPVRLIDGEPREVQAVTYIVDRSHDQYAGKLSLDRQLDMIRQGVGSAGACTDYVIATLEHLREMQIHDHLLEAIDARLRRAA